jgi:hypothetical protein
MKMGHVIFKLTLSHFQKPIERRAAGGSRLWVRVWYLKKFCHWSEIRIDLK